MESRYDCYLISCEFVDERVVVGKLPFKPNVDKSICEMAFMKGIYDAKAKFIQFRCQLLRAG